MNWYLVTGVVLVIFGLYILLKKRKKNKEYDVVFWVTENEKLHVDSNIEYEQQYIHAAVAFIIKIAWVFSSSNAFVADQIYRRLCYMSESTIQMISLSEVPKNQKFKISLIGTSFTTKLPLIGDLYIMEGVFCFQAFVYDIINPENKEKLLLILKKLVPYVENVDSSIRGLLNLNSIMLGILNDIFSK
jgi:LPXTG-motif cell wall-anchored protein